MKYLVTFIITTLIALPASAAKWDHIHLLVSDSKAAQEWYAEHFDGTPTKAGPFDAILFGPDLMKFRRSKPDTKGSVGSSIHQIGFSVPDVKRKLAELKAAGIKVVQEIIHSETANLSYAKVEDPWGTLIEILDAQDVKGFHHAYLLSADPAAAIKWYAKTFGGTPSLYKNIEGLHAIQYDDMWLMIGQGENLQPTEGRVIDHIGWNFNDYDAALEQIKANKTEFNLAPRPAKRPVMAYIYGPDKAKIEVLRAEGH